jgi:hypothetical protein
MPMNTKTDMFHKGSKLNNGARVIEWRIHPMDGYVILADTNAVGQPYVTWRCFYSDGHDTYQGHYFAKLSEAALDFETR